MHSSSVLCIVISFNIKWSLIIQTHNKGVHFVVRRAGRDCNKILSGGDLSHYQVPHCIRVFFYFVWFVFIHHNFQFYFESCTYCNILDINLLFYMELFCDMFGSVLGCQLWVNSYQLVLPYPQTGPCFIVHSPALQGVMQEWACIITPLVV